MVKTCLILACLLISFLGTSQEKQIGHGSYIPLYGTDSKSVFVNDFMLDVYPVTNQQYLEFVKKHPKWRKSKAIRLFSDENYLSKWENDTVLGKNVLPKSPVTMISWFAAKAYCDCQEGRLPTMDEWEYVAMASETQPNAQQDSIFNLKIISSYEIPKTYKKAVGSTYKNYWGIYDMHGLVWEWTSDFNSVLISGESRNNKNGDGQLFCAGGAVGASDLMDYAAFMRYAFRSSIKANYCILNLGFRCAKNYEK